MIAVGAAGALLGVLAFTRRDLVGSEVRHVAPNRHFHHSTRRFSILSPNARRCIWHRSASSREAPSAGEDAGCASMTSVG